jgi:hypothetical protein
MPGKGKRGRRVKKTKPTIYHAAREGLIADLELFLQQETDVNEPDNVGLRLISSHFLELGVFLFLIGHLYIMHVYLAAKMQ